VGKHSKADSVTVSIDSIEGGLRLRVQDNGVGFDPQVPRRQESLGLAGLRERAHLLKGTVVVHSKPGQGTTIDAFIPVGVQP
jgi:signal transduction histidine kinase